MGVLWTLDRLLEMLASTATPADLGFHLTDIAQRLGFEYVWLARYGSSGTAMPSLTSFPRELARSIEELEREGSNPLRRAARRTCVGFGWHDIPGMVDFTHDDHAFITTLDAAGLKGGFSVPAIADGSILLCSLCGMRSAPLHRGERVVAQLVGQFACDRYARFHHHPTERPVPVRLTCRQQDCLLWAARGKTDWETGKILGIGEETVETHLRQARERYRLTRRISLIVHALSDETIKFGEVLYW